MRFVHVIVTCSYPPREFSNPEWTDEHKARVSPAWALRKWGGEGWRVAAMDLTPRTSLLCDGDLQTVIVFEHQIA